MYQHFGDVVPLESLIRDIAELEDGGTLAVHLGIHALQRGYRAAIYTYNLRIFDPTWFNPTVKDFRERLLFQTTYRKDKKRRLAAQAYLEFLDAGGVFQFQDLNGRLIRSYLNRNVPILTGLSSTYLYGTSREMPDTEKDDDLRGEPCGHFVVLCGYELKPQKVIVADPYDENPMATGRLYKVKMNRLIGAILLGVLTYDANLLILEPNQD